MKNVLSYRYCGELFMTTTSFESASLKKVEDVAIKELERL
jgi:hypothetical protein